MRVPLIACLFAGCTPSADPDKEETPPTTSSTAPAPTCGAPEYGDGQCQLDLACAEPDIDCFTLFDSHAEAVAFFEAFEARWAAEELRPARPVLPADDPRWQQLRALLDQGWESYRQAFPVGDLAQRSPALLLIEDATVNAFVIPDLDNDRSAFLVVVQTGLMAEAPSEEALLGLMLHELEHSVALHVIGDTRERTRTFYLAAEGDEPIGARQVDDPVVRQYGEAWRSLAGEVGPRVDAGLGGLPLPLGLLGELFVRVIYDRLGQDPGACTAAAEQYSAVIAEAMSHYDPVDDELVVPLDSGVLERSELAMAALRDECLHQPGDQFLPLFAAALGVSEADLRQGLPPETLALVDGQPFVDGMALVVAGLRAELRALEDAFAAETAVDWSGLRYFSVEEAADDVTVPVLAGASMAPDALGELLLLLLPPEARDTCRQRVAQGDPAYGEDLLDEHHAVCWRVGHLGALASAPAVSRSYRPAPRPSPSPALHASPLLPEALRPRRLADKVLY